MKKIDAVRTMHGAGLAVAVLVLAFAIYKMVVLNWFENASTVTMLVAILIILGVSIVLWNAVVDFFKNTKGETKK